MIFYNSTAFYKKLLNEDCKIAPGVGAVRDGSRRLVG
jgi:hypothetical protein